MITRGDAGGGAVMQATVARVDDFALDGAGNDRAWARADWLPLTPLNGTTHATRAKLMYSASGFYALFDCDDRVLRCTHDHDQADLFNEDVVEVFLQPDAGQRSYIEYELSPLDHELALMVVADGERFHGWLPWKYDGARRCRHATSVRGGERAPGARVSGWTAELFIPFALMRGLAATPPTPGTHWRANLTRIDYDEPAAPRHSAWSPIPDSPRFHHLESFGTLLFA